MSLRIDQKGYFIESINCFSQRISFSSINIGNFLKLKLILKRHIGFFV